MISPGYASIGPNGLRFAGTAGDGGSDNEAATGPHGTKKADDIVAPTPLTEKRGNRSMAITDEDRAALRTAWHNHCDALRLVMDEAIDGKIGDPRDGDELAGLMRSIGRMSAMCLQQRLDFNDPDFPVFLRQMDDRYRYGGPDTNISYFMASLRGQGTYRVRGNNNGQMVNVGNLWSNDISADPDGTFDVTVSASAQPGDWTPIAPELSGETEVTDQYPTAGNGLTVRRYDWDWDRDHPPGWLNIERVDDEAPDYPALLTAQTLSAQIENATRLFMATAHWWNTRAANVRAENPVNTITPPSSTPPGVRNFKPKTNDGKAWLYYGIICLDLEEEDAILIETDLPDGDYWSFTLYNMWWETPDLMNRQTSLNSNQTHIDDDGKARFVIAARDPGVPNWLDTGGMRRGFLHYRWFRPQSRMPVPESRLTKVNAIRAALPSQHPNINAEERRAILSRRREQLAKRFGR